MHSENGALHISKDWKLFAMKLSGVISKMVEDQMLVISEKHSSGFVQFAAQGGFGLRAEISSNAYLSESDRLTGIQIARLIKAGWGAPTGKPAEAQMTVLRKDNSMDYFQGVVTECLRANP